MGFHLAHLHRRDHRNFCEIILLHMSAACGNALLCPDKLSGTSYATCLRVPFAMRESQHRLVDCRVEQRTNLFGESVSCASCFLLIQGSQKPGYRPP
jgi:hypothetical protein